MKHLLSLLLALILMPGAALAAPASDWVEEGGARVRIIAGTPASDGSLRAGLEISLEPGWKTYWINPGPGGLPPRLDVSGSENLRGLEPLWPAPQRFDEGDVQAVGYERHVIAPLRIEPEKPGEPVRLRIKFDFGICEKLCVPGSVNLSFDLDPAHAPDALADMQLKGFEQRVPRSAALGGDAPLAVTALARADDALGITVRFPEGARNTDLFAASPGANLLLTERTGVGNYRLPLEKGQALKTLNLIAVTEDEAISVTVPLDLSAPKP